MAQIAAALAVLTAVIGAWTLVQSPLRDTGVQSGRSVSDGAGSDDPVKGDQSARSGAQPATSVPSSFTLEALSASSAKHLFGVGLSSCGASRCPALVASSDSGKTWKQLHTFASADIADSQGAAQPDIQPGGAITQVLFTSATRGYVFGGDLWQTKDAGRTFTEVPHPGASVLDVQISGNHTYVLSATNCVQGQCSGRLRLSEIDGDELSKPLAEMTLAAPIAAGHVVVSGRDVVISTSQPAGDTDGPSAWRLNGATLEPLSTRGLCNGKSILAVAGTPRPTSSIGQFAAVCDAAITTRRTTLSTITSLDGAVTWQPSGQGSLSLPTQGHISLIASDDRLVAASGGPRVAPDGTTRVSSGSAIVTSTDDGRTWKPSRGLQDSAVGGFDALIARGDDAAQPDGKAEIYAIAGTYDGYWRSTDSGTSWSKAHPLASGD